MKYLILVLSALCIGCGGGGGGGGGDESQFIGAYGVRLVAVENTCEFSVEPITRTYTVNQVESRIVVDSSSGSVFEGITTGDDRFLVSLVGVANCVDTNGNEIPTSTFQYTSTLEFIFDDPDSPRVTFKTDSGNCSGNSTGSACRYSMTGTAEREA